jgi:hypothetical protein
MAIFNLFDNQSSKKGLVVFGKGLVMPTGQLALGKSLNKV